jgi:cardiolipin synthase
MWSLFGNAAARADLRNHRKIVVIDGRVAYTGSQNLVDAHFKAGIIYEELVVRMVGPIALALQYVFASDWFLETDELLDSADNFPDPQLAGAMPIQVLPSGPTFPVETTQRLVVAGIHAARRRVVLTTPYFIPDDALLQALQTAVLRGVEVHLVVSAKKDQFLVCLAQESYYEELLEKGVQVHLYEGNFLHAKHLSIDDHLALVGSSNMDIRSFKLNAEASVLVYSPEFVGQLHAEQLRCFRDCRLLTLADWRARSGWSRFGQNMARLMSPLL